MLPCFDCCSASGSRDQRCRFANPIQLLICSRAKYQYSRQGDIPDLNILIAPLVEQLDATNLIGNLLRQDIGGRLCSDLGLAGFRHDGDLVLYACSRREGVKALSVTKISTLRSRRSSMREGRQGELRVENLGLANPRVADP